MRTSAWTLVLLLAVPLAPMGDALAPLPFFPQNDAGSGRDAPDHRSSDIVVAPGIVYEGDLDGLVDGADWYAFHANAGAAIEIRAHTTGVHCVYLHDPSGTEMGFSCNQLGLSEALGWTLTATAASSGLHYLRISYFVPQSYTFAIGIDAPAPGALVLLEHDDAGSGRDAPDALSADLVVQPGVAYKGRLDGLADRADWYAFGAKPGDAIEVRARTTGVHCLYLVDPTGAEIDFTCNIAGVSEAFDLGIRTTAALDGTHYVRVSYFDAQFYSFGIGLNGPAPVDLPLPEM